MTCPQVRALLSEHLTADNPADSASPASGHSGCDAGLSGLAALGLMIGLALKFKR